MHTGSYSEERVREGGGWRGREEGRKGIGVQEGQWKRERLNHIPSCFYWFLFLFLSAEVPDGPDNDGFPSICRCCHKSLYMLFRSLLAVDSKEIGL